MPTREGRQEGERTSAVARILFCALMAVVALAPLPLGGNRPVAWSALGLAVGLLLVIWAVAAMRDRSLMAVAWRRIWPAAAIFSALIAWYLFQAAAFSPGDWHNPIWLETSQALTVSAPGTISVNPVDTITGVLRLLTYGGVFWLALQLGRDAGHARQALWILAMAGVGYAAYGLVMTLGRIDMILWFERWAYQGSLTSTFVNRNTYAAYAGLSLIVILALMAPKMSDSLRLGLFSRAGFLHFLDSVRLPLYFLMVAFVVVTTALLFSRSRGGLLVALFGITVFLACSAAPRRKRRGRTFLGLGLALLVAVYVLVSFSGDATLARFADLAASGTGRAQVHALSAQAIADRPLVGTGLGTFAETFQQYRDDTFDVLTLAYQKAHSTYLELALEGGLPAFVAMMVLFAGLTGLCLRGVIVRRQDKVYPAIGLGATALVAAHSAVDFSVQIPGFALTYLLLMGIACAQSWPSGAGGTGTHMRPRSGGSRRRSGAGARARRAAPD